MPMKKILLSVITVLLAINAGAQVYLKTLKPVEEKLYSTDNVYNTPWHVARFEYKGSFKIGAGSGLVKGDPGYVEFSLKGAYEKLSFVIGPCDPNSAGMTSNAIVTIKADGNKIFDQVIRTYDTPREFILDVKGVDRLRIAILHGEENIAFGNAILWKAGQTPKPAPDPFASLNNKKRVELVQELWPHFIRHSGWIHPITKIKHDGYGQMEESISINRNTFNSGLSLVAAEEFGKQDGWAFFWLQKKYDKVSFILGPRDNQSSNARGWLTVKGDGKILLEKVITQKDLAEQIVLDVKGVDNLMFLCEHKDSDFLGGLTFGAVNIYAHKAGDTVPTPGIVNLSKGRLSKLPDVCKLIYNIKPYSVRGVSKAANTIFDGESDYYHFSMGGEQFSEGIILTTGNNFWDDNIDSYATFDLAGEFDWISFKAGTLTNHRVLDDDKIRVYADDQLVLETTIHATHPNQYFEIPVYKCRSLRFAKPGTNKKKQTYIGIADIICYRGKPVENNLFVHPKPDCPEVADLIDLTHGPYFHYVGRFLSSLTNFSINDCFKDGSTQKEYFAMKDGSKIYKGIMLETNIPLGFEDISMSEALFMFVVGAGSSISSSNVAAVTGVSAGAGLGGAMAAAKLFDDGGGQSSVAAFNPFGEYESCTFTVANRTEYIDEFDKIFGGAKQAPPVKLNVFADQRLVGEYWLNDKMQPTTYTVPIFNCHQLMFWLQCGDVRSGQYVLYDMTVSKQPCNIAIPEEMHNSAATENKAAKSTEVTPALGSSDKSTAEKPSKAIKTKKTKGKKEVEPVVWDLDRHCRNEAVQTYLADVTAVWKATEDLRSQMGANYSVKEVWVQAQDGSVYKCVSLVDGKGNRLSTTDIQKDILASQELGKQIQTNAGLAKIGLPSASLGLPNLPTLEEMTYFGKYVKMSTQALNQCSKEAKEMVEIKQMELDTVQGYIKSAVNVGEYKSTARVMIIPPLPGETAPATMQRLEYFSF